VSEAGQSRSTLFKALHGLGLLVAWAILAAAVSVRQPLAWRCALLLLGLGHVAAVWALVAGRTQKLTLLSFSLAALLLGVHVAFPGEFRGIQVRSSAGGPLRNWTNRLVPESTATVLAVPLLTLGGVISPTEAEGFSSALRQEYTRLSEAVGGVPPTPLITTFTGGQSSQAFDVVTIRTGASGRDSAIMLHGFGGNWLLLCWLVADALRDSVSVTVCPSSAVGAPWGSHDGRQTVLSIIRRLRDEGLNEPLLIGLSAGAVGASELSQELPGEFRAAALLFGAATFRSTPHLPTLYVYGSQDERFPVDFILEAASTHRSAGGITRREIQSTHFGLVTARKEVQAALRAWVETLPRTP